MFWVMGIHCFFGGLNQKICIIPNINCPIMNIFGSESLPGEEGLHFLVS